jgi:hypothetical protein
MHFFVDESGHTGPNLFDSHQPMLYYGVLSSRLNVDVMAESVVRSLRRRLAVPRLHAAELGNAGLASVANDLVGLQRRLDLRFDFYRVAKPDHAVICFFDQVFDQGVNPAMTWTGYWTPLRYVLLLKVASLFDEGLARLAWDARLQLDDRQAERLVSEVCYQLLERVGRLPDARSRQLMGDVLTWAAEHPQELSYNAQSKLDRLSVMPNVIGFQSVMTGIASRLLKAKRKAARVVVDQQSQFNRAQRTLHEYYMAASKVTLQSGPGLPEVSYRGVPDVPIEFLGGANSYGLELVDVYLWTFRRIVERQEVAPSLIQLALPQMRRGQADEISLRAIEKRWTRWFEDLPAPTHEQMEKAKVIQAIDEGRRVKALSGRPRVEDC